MIRNPTIEDLRKQVEAQSYCHVNYPPHRAKHLLDVFSMSALVQLHDAMSPEARAKLNGMVSTSFVELSRALDFAMRQMR